MTAFIGPSGCGKTTLLRAEPDERPDPQRGPGRARSATTATTCRPVDRPGRGAAADRDGVPAAEPVPQVDLRQRRLRPPAARPCSDMKATVEQALRRAALWDEVKDRLEQRAVPVRRPAATAVHRPRDRRRSRRDPDGRAGVGARPRCDAQKIEDLIAEIKHDYTIVIVTHNMQQASRVADMTAFFSVRRGRGGKRTAARRIRSDRPSSPSPAIRAPRRTSPAGSGEPAFQRGRRRHR